MFALFDAHISSILLFQSMDNTSNTYIGGDDSSVKSGFCSFCECMAKNHIQDMIFPTSRHETLLIDILQVVPPRPSIGRGGL